MGGYPHIIIWWQRWDTIVLKDYSWRKQLGDNSHFGEKPVALEKTAYSRGLQGKQWTEEPAGGLTTGDLRTVGY